MKKAFITGATGGLGKALSHLLADQGVDLFLTARDKNQLDQLAAQLKVDVTCHPADLADPDQRKALLQRLEQYAPDLIINNAGFGLYGEAVKLSIEEQLQMIEVNVKALFEISLSGAKLFHLQQKKGTIVNISSTTAFFTIPTFAAYSATKAFVNHFSQSLDQELRPFGIRVLVSCPGQIRTGFRKKAARYHPQKGHSLLGMTPGKAAKAVLYQIEKGKSLYIFDWRYRLGLFLFRTFLPQRWVSALLRRSIKKRIQPDKPS